MVVADGCAADVVVVVVLGVDVVVIVAVVVVDVDVVVLVAASAGTDEFGAKVSVSEPITISPSFSILASCTASVLSDSVFVVTDDPPLGWAPLLLLSAPARGSCDDFNRVAAAGRESTVARLRGCDRVECWPSPDLVTLPCLADFAYRAPFIAFISSSSDSSNSFSGTTFLSHSRSTKGIHPDTTSR